MLKRNDCVIFNGVLRSLGFDGIIRQVIYQLKYRNLRALAAPLAQLLNVYLLINPVPGEDLGPVPLYRKRLGARGYNQAGLLAKELGKLTHLPVADDCLVRQRHAPPQVRTSTVEERQSNVADALVRCNQRLQDKQVLLIDGVSASGPPLMPVPAC